MNWSSRSEAAPVHFERDVPTTLEDAEMLRRLARDTPSWLLLTQAEIDALLPERLLDLRPAISARATPFTLPPLTRRSTG